MTNTCTKPKTLVVEAVIFDMDGTIIDNMEYHITAWIKFLQQHGITMSTDNFHKELAGDAKSLIQRKFQQPLTDSQIHSMLEEKEALYRQLYQEDIKELAGLSPLLQSIKAQKIKIGIATLGNKKNVDFSIKGLGISSFLDSIKKSEDITHGKPHPEIYQKSLDTLNVAPENAIAFEDSEVGIRAAIDAGISAIGVQTSHERNELLDWGAIDTIEDYVEFSEKYTLVKSKVVH